MKRSIAIIAGIAALAGAAFWLADSTIRQRHGRYIHCLSNFRQIDSAKEQIAMRDGLQPGDPVAAADVVAYCIPAVTNCASGGTISVGKIGEDPSCTVHGSISSPKRVRFSLFKE